MILSTSDCIDQTPTEISFPASRQSAPRRRPVVVDKIEYIAQQAEDDSTSVFYVALSNGSGPPICARLRPLELRHFALLKIVLKNRLGIEFDDHGRYSGRKGQDSWESDLFNLLDGELPC